MRFPAAVLSIGDEVLKGSVLNTNAAFLGKNLSELGFEVVTHTVCPDSEEAIRFQIGELFRRVDLVIMCGGLGPTPDDVTREGVASYYHAPLVFSEKQYGRLRLLYRRFRKKIPRLVRREAFYPANTKPLLNRFGIALGFFIERQGKVAVALPGVPAELENMFRDVVRPVLRKYFPSVRPHHQLIVKLTGIPEPEVMKRLGKDFFDDCFEFGIYPFPGEVMVRIYADTPSVISRLRRKIAARLGNFIYAWDDLSLAQVVGGILTQKKRTLAVAESCTGGLLAAEIAGFAGTSCFLKGGIVAYDAEIKEKLGICPEIIRRKGEVSAEVAGDLALKVKTRMNADYGIGITGIAGPGGGSPRKPVGLVYIGLSGPKGRPQVREYRFWGDRNQVRRRSVIKALENLWRSLL